MNTLQIDKKEALGILRGLRDEIATLDSTSAQSHEFKLWRKKTLAALEHVFGAESAKLRDFMLIRFALPPHRIPKPVETIRAYYQTALDNADCTLEALIDETEQFWASPDDATTKEFNCDGSLTRLFNRFHLVARQLKQRHDDRNTIEINDEYDVQDLLHAMLRVEFDDVRPEEWTPSYAGKSSRTDFLLKNEQVFIEVKMARKGLDGKVLGEQLTVDIAYYKGHADCKSLYCFVYDPDNQVRNPRGFENDLSREHDGLPVQVFVRPE